jgi:hypothetical protein
MTVLATIQLAFWSALAARCAIFRHSRALAAYCSDLVMLPILFWTRNRFLRSPFPCSECKLHFCAQCHISSGQPPIPQQAEQKGLCTIPCIARYSLGCHGSAMSALTPRTRSTWPRYLVGAPHGVAGHLSWLRGYGSVLSAKVLPPSHRRSHRHPFPPRPTASEPFSRSRSRRAWDHLDSRWPRGHHRRFARTSIAKCADASFVER